MLANEINNISEIKNLPLCSFLKLKGALRSLVTVDKEQVQQPGHSVGSGTEGKLSKSFSLVQQASRCA